MSGAADLQLDGDHHAPPILSTPEIVQTTSEKSGDVRDGIVPRLYNLQLEVVQSGDDESGTGDVFDLGPRGRSQTVEQGGEQGAPGAVAVSEVSSSSDEGGRGGGGGSAGGGPVLEFLVLDEALTYAEDLLLGPPAGTEDDNELTLEMILGDYFSFIQEEIYE